MATERGGTAWARAAPGTPSRAIGGHRYPLGTVVFERQRVTRPTQSYPSFLNQRCHPLWDGALGPLERAAELPTRDGHVLPAQRTGPPWPGPGVAGAPWAGDLVLRFRLTRGGSGGQRADRRPGGCSGASAGGCGAAPAFSRTCPPSPGCAKPLASLPRASGWQEGQPWRTSVPPQSWVTRLFQARVSALGAERTHCLQGPQQASGCPSAVCQGTSPGPEAPATPGCPQNPRQVLC